MASFVQVMTCTPVNDNGDAGGGGGAAMSVLVIVQMTMPPSPTCAVAPLTVPSTHFHVDAS